MSRNTLQLTLIVLLLGGVQARAQQVGQPVFLIAPAKTYLGKEVRDSFDSDSIGANLFVNKINGDWLRIISDTPGWIHRQSVVSLADAENYFGSRIEKGERSWTLYRGRANARLFQGKSKEAIADLTQAISSASKVALPALYANRAEAQLILGNLEQCINDAEQVIDRVRLAGSNESTAAQGYYFRGFARHLQGNLRDAENDYDEAIQRDPKYHPPMLRRGLIRRDTGRYSLAVEDLTAVLKIDPNFHAARNDRGTAYVLLGDYEAAVEDFRQLVDQAPEAAFATQSRENAIYADGKAQSQHFKLLDPKRSPYLNLIMLFAACPEKSIRNAEEAIRLAKQLRKLDGGRYYPFIAAEAAAYAEEGEFEKAVALQDEAIAVAPQAERESLKAALVGYRAEEPYRFPNKTP